MKQAVCILIKVPDSSYFLTVSRKNDETQWGLPGGKVDNDELYIDSIIRETKEEIGLTVEKNQLSVFFTGICLGDVDYEVTTYLYKGNFNFCDLKPEEGITLGYSTRAELCDPYNSPFAEYNTKMFEALDRTYHGI